MLVINKFKLNILKIIFILKSNKYITVFWILIFLCFLNLFNIPNDITYEEKILNSISSPLFMVVLIGTLFMSSSLIISYIDKDYSKLLRFKNKKYYLKDLMLSVSITNLVLFLFTIFTNILFVSIFNIGYIKFENYIYYEIPFLIYNIFTIIKYYLIINYLALIGICLYKNINKVVGYIYYFLILMFYYTYPIKALIINDFKINNLFFKYYLVPYVYLNFKLEIISFLITIVFLIIILFIVMYITIRKNKIKIDE